MQWTNFFYVRILKILCSGWYHRGRKGNFKICHSNKFTKHVHMGLQDRNGQSSQVIFPKLLKLIKFALAIIVMHLGVCNKLMVNVYLQLPWRYITLHNCVMPLPTLLPWLCRESDNCRCFTVSSTVLTCASILMRRLLRQLRAVFSVLRSCALVKLHKAVSCTSCRTSSRAVLAVVSWSTCCCRRSRVKASLPAEFVSFFCWRGIELGGFDRVEPEKGTDCHGVMCFGIEIYHM